MEYLKIWFLDFISSQNKMFVIIIVLTIARMFFISSETVRTEDYYSSIVYLTFIVWIYFTMFFEVELSDRLVFKKILIKDKDFIGKALKLTILIYVANRSFFIFGKAGVFFSLFLITITFFIIIYHLFVKHVLQELIERRFEYQSLIYLFPIIGFLGLVYFAPWRIAFCNHFGVEEIGHIFEKEYYESKYYIEISTDIDNSYKLPADIVVLDKMAKYEIEDDLFGYSGLFILRNYNSRYAKIKKVYFNNGGYLLFDDCLAPIDRSFDCDCRDQNGRTWWITTTRMKEQ